MKHLYKLFFILIVFIAAWSCNEDNGNYDYTNVDQIKIDTVGMENRFIFYSNLQIGDLIELEPNVTYADNKESLEYYWIVYPFYYNEVSDGNSMVYPQADTIGVSPKLDWQVDIEPGQYRLQFLVVDPIKKIRSYFDFSRFDVVAGGVKSGLYVLSEYAGQTDIDLYGSSRALIIGGDHFTPHYYSQNHGGELLSGKPSFISFGKDYYYAFTDKVGKRLSTLSLLEMDDFSQMFYAAPVYNPQNLVYINNCEFLINNGQLHVLYTDKANDRKFSVPIAGDYNASPFLARLTRTSYSPVLNAIGSDQIIFDQNINGFRPYFPRETRLGNFKSTATGAILDANKMPTTVVKSFEANGGQTYNIMDIGGKDSLFVLSFYNVVDDGDLSVGSSSKVDLSGCKDIKSAKYFTSSNAGNAFFYATDKGVYSFSYTSGQKNQLNIYEAASGDEITAIYILPSGGFPTGGAVLWIGVWNEENKEGTLVEFEINPTSGAISNQWSPIFAPNLSNPSITKGFGKIKSMVVKM